MHYSGDEFFTLGRNTDFLNTDALTPSSVAGYSQIVSKLSMIWVELKNSWKIEWFLRAQWQRWSLNKRSVDKESKVKC